MKEMFEGYQEDQSSNAEGIILKYNIAKFLQDVQDMVLQDGKDILTERWNDIQVLLEQRLPVTGFTFKQYYERLLEVFRILSGDNKKMSGATGDSPYKHNSSFFFSEGIMDDKLTVEVGAIWSAAHAP